MGTRPPDLDEMPPLAYDRRVLQPLVVPLRTISYCLVGFLSPEDLADADYYPTGQFSLSLDRPGGGREVRITLHFNTWHVKSQTANPGNILAI